MTVHTTIAQPDLAIASQFIEFLTGNSATPLHIRCLPERDKTRDAFSLHGTLPDLWPRILEAQAKGDGIFAVINAGGIRDSEITRIRAVFVDADGKPLPEKWHVQPDFIAQRDDTHWHAYWRVLDLPVDLFRSVQQRLASYYGTDPTVCNPSRVMRLAGTLHLKAAS